MKKTHLRFWWRLGVTRPGDAGLLAIVLGITSGCIDFGRARTGLYESWCTQNGGARERFKRLAIAESWEMCALAYDRPEFHFTAIGHLDPAAPKFTALYEVPRGRRIAALARLQDGRVCFIEARAPLRPPFALGIIEGLGTTVKSRLPVNHVDLPVPIAGGRRHLFFTDWARRAWLYDMQQRSLDTVFDLGPGQDKIVKVAMVGDEFLLILRHASGTGTMVVLDGAKPHRQVSKIDGVSDMLVVGDHIVVEKHDVCFLYDPHSGATEGLTAGKLLTKIGNDEFLFCPADWSAPERGIVSLYRYKISSRSDELLWEPPAAGSGFRISPGQKKNYDYTKVFFSPDGGFLFVPWEITPLSKAEVILPRTLEYEVYDLISGEVRGAFLNLFEGKFHLEFLGWATGGPGPQSQQEGPAEAEKVPNSDK
jgi:hypothetical protein